MQSETGERERRKDQKTEHVRPEQILAKALRDRKQQPSQAANRSGQAATRGYLRREPLCD